MAGEAANVFTADKLLARRPDEAHSAEEGVGGKEQQEGAERRGQEVKDGRKNTRETTDELIFVLRLNWTFNTKKQQDIRMKLGLD